MKLSHLFESHQLLLEAKARIDHPEDLIFDQGMQGASAALQILQTTADNPQSVSIKFDGSPALIFGWQDGEFMLTDKAGFSAKGYNGLTTNAADIESMIMNRKMKDTSPEAVQVRAQYASGIASLYNKLKQVVPRNFQGYAQGDLMWTQTPPVVAGAYEFKPVKIKYRVPVDSELGKQIGASDVGIVIHSVYASPAEEEPTALTDVKKLGFKDTAGVIILPHEFTVTQKLTLDSHALQLAHMVLRNKGAQIARFLDATELASREIKALPGIMKSFVAHKAKLGDDNFSHAPEEFLDYVITPVSKVNVKMAPRIIDWINENITAYNAVWQFVQHVVGLKMDLKQQIDSEAKGVISASLRDVPGHEGFVSVTPEGIIKLVDRAEFMKKDDMLTEQTTDATESHTPRRVVFTYARMNPPTLGHRMLVDKMKSEAGADDYWVFLSHSRDPKLNPLTWEQKVQFVKQIMKPHAAHVITDPSVKLLFKTFKWLYDQGYRDINMVVGSDRVAEMTQNLQNWNSDKKRIPDGRDRVIVKVINAGQRDPDSDDETPDLDKPTTAADTPVAATPTPDLDKPTAVANKPDDNQVKISAISGTKARKAVEDRDLPAFEKFTGLKGTVASKLFKTVQIGMNTPKEKAPKTVVKENTLEEAVPLNNIHLREGKQSDLGHIVMLRMSDTHARKLTDWCAQQGIPCMDPEHMHLTLIRTVRPEPYLLKLDNTETHVTAHASGWKMLGASSLVLSLDSPQCMRMHYHLTKSGPQHQFPDYIPHVSVSYKWHAGMPMPTQVPDFELVFDWIEAERVDPNFAAKTS